MHICQKSFGPAASDDPYTILCFVISSDPHVKFRPLLTFEQQVFIENLLCIRYMKIKVWPLRKNYGFRLPLNFINDLKLLWSIFCSIFMRLSNLMKKYHANEHRLVKTLAPWSEVECGYLSTYVSVSACLCPYVSTYIHTYTYICIINNGLHKSHCFAES